MRNERHPGGQRRHHTPDGEIHRGRRRGDGPRRGEHPFGDPRPHRGGAPHVAADATAAGLNAATSAPPP
ncbi:MAG: hypothetical protein WAX14_12575 [Rhodococcus sp. (in: high G+C Gram-positive bacteria)]|uniref:hypothetical protein n=1 Tax=Rhodococcus sp. TaxID=1831 RepID=UPI003BB7ADDF